MPVRTYKSLEPNNSSSSLHHTLSGTTLDSSFRLRRAAMFNENTKPWCFNVIVTSDRNFFSLSSIERNESSRQIDDAFLAISHDNGIMNLSISQSFLHLLPMSTALLPDVVMSSSVEYASHIDRDVLRVSACNPMRCEQHRQSSGLNRPSFSSDAYVVAEERG